MEKITEEISDAVLYRNLYTNILSQQINAENRLHRLMISRQGQDTTFDEHFNKVRRKIEKDRIRIQKLGERLIIMEKKEMHAASKTRRITGNISTTKENKPGIFATLVNMESLRDEFKRARLPTEPNKNAQIQITVQEPLKSNEHNVHQNTVDPKEIEMFFEDRFSEKATNTTPTQTKNLSSQPWCSSQVAEEDFPKRVSFNDIPDVIAEWEIGKEKLKVNEEAGWNSDYSEDQPGETCGQTHFKEQSGKSYHEPPPPDFNYYSYHKRNRRSDSRTSPKTPDQTRTHKSAERSYSESRKSFSKYPEAQNHDESWDVINEQGNNPFGSPWEGVISTSLQRQRNDSTQAVPSSTTNNEEDLLLCSKTVENERTTVETVPDICKNIDTSNDANDKTASTENDFKMEPKEETINDEFLLGLPEDSNVQEEMNEQTKIYEGIVKNARDPKFIKDDTLTAMRRQSWSTHPPENNKKQQKRRGKLASVFRRPGKKNQGQQVIKADKKELPVTKKVRRRMSLRPLPETPDVVEENQHTLQGNTTDSLDTFH